MKILFKLFICVVIVGGLVVGGIFLYNNYFKTTVSAFELIENYYADTSRLQLQEALSSNQEDYVATAGHSLETRYSDIEDIILRLDNASMNITDYLSITKDDKKDLKTISALLKKSQVVRSEAIEQLGILAIILDADSSVTSDIEEAYNACYGYLCNYVLQYNKAVSSINNYVIEHHYSGHISNFYLTDFKIMFDVIQDAYSHIEDSHIVVENQNNFNKYMSHFVLDDDIVVDLNDTVVGYAGIAHPYVGEFLKAYSSCNQELFASSFLTNLSSKVAEVDASTTDMQKAIYYYSEIVGVE